MLMFYYILFFYVDAITFRNYFSLKIEYHNALFILLLLQNYLAVELNVHNSDLFFLLVQSLRHDIPIRSSTN